MILKMNFLVSEKIRKNFDVEFYSWLCGANF